jgi:hypothetical protein
MFIIYCSAVTLIPYCYIDTNVPTKALGTNQRQQPASHIRFTIWTKRDCGHRVLFWCCLVLSTHHVPTFGHFSGHFWSQRYRLYMRGLVPSTHHVREGGAGEAVHDSRHCPPRQLAPRLPPCPLCARHHRPHLVPKECIEFRV